MSRTFPHNDYPYHDYPYRDPSTPPHIVDNYSTSNGSVLGIFNLLWSALRLIFSMLFLCLRALVWLITRLTK